MGPLIKLIILNVIAYVICKFVVPNVPGSAPPGEYPGLSSPVQKTPANIKQGKVSYAAFCPPCHGGNSDGKGPAARGFNPPPANFPDPTPIAMLQESYLFWRIKKGGVGLQ